MWREAIARSAVVGTKVRTRFMETIVHCLSSVLFSFAHVPWLAGWGTTAAIVAAVLFLLWLVPWLTLRRISRTIASGSSKSYGRPRAAVPEGRIIALRREAGYQAELLRGGVHFGYWRWQYRVHKTRLVTIAQGKIGYVYARDGAAVAVGPDVGTNDRVQSLSGRARIPRRRWRGPARPARPAARHSARRRVRHQRRRVRRDYRDARARLARSAGSARSAVGGAVARRAAGNQRLRAGDRRRAAPHASPARPRVRRRGRLDRHRHGARRSVAAAGRDHRPGRRHRPRRTSTITTISRSPRRFCRPAAAAAASMCR